MMSGKGYGNRHYGDGGYQQVVGLAQVSTSKVPPCWEPSLELKGYPFKCWLKDIALWSAGTELAEALKGPAVAQRREGACRELVRSVDPQELRGGRVNQATGVRETGLAYLLAGLSRRHGQYEIETATTAIIELLRFRRVRAETSTRPCRGLRPYGRRRTLMRTSSCRCPFFRGCFLRRILCLARCGL